MLNPWTSLPQEPRFVLAEDAPYVDAFNEQVGIQERFRLDLGLVPGAFEGPRDEVLSFSAATLVSPFGIRRRRLTSISEQRLRTSATSFKIRSRSVSSTSSQTPPPECGR